MISNPDVKLPTTPSQETNGTPPAGGGTPAGTSMPSQTDKPHAKGENCLAVIERGVIEHGDTIFVEVEHCAIEKRSIKPLASRRLVRVDYHRKTTITYAEAALIAGVAVNTVEKWICAGVIPYAAKVGPYRIAREHLDKYLKTGKPVR